MTALDGLPEDLASQRDFVAERVPVYARILDLLPDVLPRDRLEAAWADRSFGAWYERPLLLLAALRDDALEAGPAHPLWAAIGEREPDPASATRDALAAALEADRPLWRKLAERHVQTNETSRAVAWLWPAKLLADADPERPLRLFDVGASAGLNLVADALPPLWTRSNGAPLEMEPLPRIEGRTGYDLRPMDVTEEAAARWLRACVWPGQSEREDRLERAIGAWGAADPPPRLVQARAGDVPDLLPTGKAEGARMLAYQTVMRDYVPAEEWRRYEAGMQRWVESGPPGSATWVELEVTDAAREGGPPAAIIAHVPGATLVLATCHPHPSELEVDDGAVRTLLELLD